MLEFTNFQESSYTSVSEKTHMTKLLKKIIDCIPVNLYWKTTTGVYQGCNHAALGVFLTSPLEDTIGKSVFDMLLAELIRIGFSPSPTLLTTL